MTKLKRLYLLIAAVMLAGISEMSAQMGSSAYNFLEIPTSSHVNALGGAAAAIIDDDISLIDQNPALLGSEIETTLGFNYMLYMGTSNFAGARFGKAAGERGAWAAGIRYLDYGSMQGYESDGTPTNSFHPQDIAFEGTYSHDFTDRLRGGINLKMIYSHYEEYSAFAMAADIGLSYYDDEHDLSLAVVLKNMGGQLKRFDQSYDRLPFDIQLSYMQGLGSSPFSLQITAWHLNKWALPYYTHDKSNPEEQQKLKSSFISNLFRHLVFGLQYMPSEKFYIALGYNYKTYSDMGVYHRNFLSGFSLGTGLKVKSFGIGVAYSMPHKSASSLTLNLSCNFAELLGR